MSTLTDQYNKLSDDFTWGVAIDGSDMSMKALKVVMSLIKEMQEGKLPKIEKVRCLHVENPEKQNAPSLSSVHFKHSAYLLFDKEHLLEMKWHQALEKCASQTGIYQLLEAMATDIGVSLLVMGTFGLNGEKLNKIGSMTQLSMANSRMPVMVIKRAEILMV